ncbi:FtsX-like permease family protein [Micromonospora schwarzwaldensis]|uniref:FtsX-like permease family protein n=1 Tax=Micromonospora sp. DSM 45708 TaxID=3111767 RepID=UPI0031E332C5
MRLPGAAGRVRAYAGQFLLLAVLTVVTALLITGVPRVADRLTGQGLTEYLAGQPVALRDVTYTTAPTTFPPTLQPVVAGQAGQLAAIEERMPDVVREVVGDRWYVADTVPGRLRGSTLRGDKGLIDLVLRTGNGLREAATLTGGRWPERGVTAAGAIEVALAEAVATGLGVAPGDRFRLSLLDPNGDPLASRPVELVGVWRPNDPGNGVWDALPSMLRLTPPEGDGDPFVAVAYTADAGVDAAAAVGWPVSFGWRYRIAPDRLVPGRLDALIAGVDGLERTRPASVTLTQGVDVPLRRFAAALAAARTLLAVIAAGLLATLAGLSLLAARLAARRRRAEFHLIRARGASTGAVLRRGLAESVLVLPAAAGTGWLLGGLLPGVGASARWVLLAALLATLLPPLAALAVGRRGAGRADLGGRSPTLRLTVEVVVLGVAVLGAFLLRRRGLTPGSVDPLLVSVPVLLAVAAALLALRAYPWPLRLLSRVTARARGSVAFLGTARAGRAASTGPLVVVVLAVATAAFCGVVATGIEAGRDTAAAHAVPGDLLVDGERFAPDTAGELAALPGVRAVAPLLTVRAERPYADRAGRPTPIRELRVLLVDGDRFAEVARRAGVPVSVPGPLLGGGDGSAPLPALVSPTVAAELAEAGLADAGGRRPAWLDVQGNRLPLRVAATTVDGFALVDREVTRFVVLPWPALPADAPHPLAPTGFVLAGPGADPAEVNRVATEGQRRYLRIGTVESGDKARAPQVTSRAAVRAELGGSGVNGLLVFGFVLGAGGGAVLGLLGLAFAVLAGARSRGQVLSRLRTMGLSRRQWRGLLLVELTPLVLVSVLTGAVVGALLPLLLTPVLGLPAFTGGVTVRPAFEPGLVAGVSALALLALGFAITVEAVNNRRMRLGEVLRLGEES